MPLSQPFQNNFTSGEISPRLNARLDVKQYRNGARVMTNAIPTLEGGFDGRPGMQYLFRVRDESLAVYLVDFVFAINQAYTIVVNDGMMWFITNRALVTEATQAVTGAVDNGSGLIQLTVTGHGYSNGDWVDIQGVGGTFEANSTWEISGVTANTFDLVGSTFTNTFSFDGTAGKIVEVAVPYAAADLPNLRWVQDKDVLYVVAGSYIPYKLTRVSATSFTFTKLYPNGPYRPLRTESDGTYHPTGTLTFTGGTPDSTSVGSTGNLISSGPLWNATDVDRVVGMAGDAGSPAVRGYLKITGYNSATDVDAEIVGEFSSAVATDQWWLGAWNSVDGWPTATTFHEQRLLMASTTQDPLRWWGSFINSPLDFVGPASSANDDSYSYTIDSTNGNPIKWMASLDTLLIGTSGEEIKVQGPNDAAIGPVLAPLVRTQTYHGSHTTPPLAIESLIMYMQWGGRRLYTLEFDPDKPQLSGQDLSFISRHLVPDGTTIIRMTYEEQPNNVVWAVRSDGVLLSMVFFPEQEVLGWSKHTTQDGLIEDVISIPNSDQGVSDTYVVVKRTVNGATRRYVEWLNRDLYVDSGLIGTFGAATTLINGLNHLIGETVATQLDSGAGSPEVVSSLGQIDISDQSSGVTSLQAGLPFVPTVSPLEPAIESTAISNAQPIGRKKKYGSIIIRTKDTKSLTVNGSTLPSRASEDLMDTTPPTEALKDWKLSELGYSTIESLTITQPLPLPIHVLAIAGTLSVGER